MGGWQRLLDLLESIPQVTLARLHGHCIGGAALLASGTLARETGPLEFPVFLTEGVEIWGATAMVLAEMLSMLGWNGPEPHRS